MQTDNWMKQRRDVLGITQDQLAERLAARGIIVTKAAISKWEMGKTPLPLQTTENRHAIAEAFELTVPQLLAFAGYEIGGEWSQQARILASLFDTLPEGERSTILKLVTLLTSDHQSDATVDRLHNDVPDPVPSNESTHPSLRRRSAR